MGVSKNKGYDVSENLGLWSLLLECVQLQTTNDIILLDILRTYDIDCWLTDIARAVSRRAEADTRNDS